ncbi:LPS translocon maturation chaperone LptM [Legionella busanensis]|nr:lipoprotein [Legionella busanensis]
MKFITVLFILLTTINLSACGQKGPLYLPPPPNQQKPVS